MHSTSHFGKSLLSHRVQLRVDPPPCLCEVVVTYMSTASVSDLVCKESRTWFTDVWIEFHPLTTPSNKYFCTCLSSGSEDRFDGCLWKASNPEGTPLSFHAVDRSCTGRCGRACACRAGVVTGDPSCRGAGEGGDLLGQLGAMTMNPGIHVHPLWVYRSWEQMTQNGGQMKVTIKLDWSHPSVKVSTNSPDHNTLYTSTGIVVHVKFIKDRDFTEKLVKPL